MANKKLNAIITIGGSVASSLGSAIGSTRRNLGRVGDAIADVTKRQKELNRIIEQEARLGRAGSALKVQYAQQELGQLDRKISRLRQVHGQLTKIGQAEKHNQARQRELQGKIGGTVGAALAVGLPVVGAAKVASQFEYQLQLIANTANMTREETLALGAAILDASRKTGQSAQQMQEAMGYLIAAGMDVKTAQASLIQIGRTATASGAEISDLAQAAFVLTDSLKIAPGQALQDALDTLAQAGKEGNVELRDMAKVLPVLGAGFVSLKMEGREAAATMGAALEIARKGAANADEAANNMKNFIAKVMSPETLKKARENFNLDLYKVIQDAQTQGKNPFDEAMKAIIKATQGDQKKIGELFQDMQVQNFLRPMIQNFEEYNRIKNVALGAKGVTDADFEKIMVTAKERTESLREEIGRLAVAVGGPLAVAFGAAAAAITPVVTTMTEFATQNPTLVASVIGVVTGLTALRVATLGASLAFTFIKGGAISLMGAAMKLWPVIRMVGTAVMFLGRVLIANPIGLAVTAIAGGAYLIYKNWEPIKAWFAELWADITATFEKSLKWITDKIDWVGQKWQKTKSFFGLGDETPAGPAIGSTMSAPSLSSRSGGGATPPSLPSPSRNRSVVFTDSSQTTIQVTQQPGQNPRQLAEEITRIQNERRGVASRSQLYDGMMVAP